MVHQDAPHTPARSAAAGLQITAVRIPEPGRETGTAAVGRDFALCRELVEAQHLELWGNLSRCLARAEAAEFWRGTEYEERQLFIARLGHNVLGMCAVELPLRDNTTTAGLDVLVAPAFRRRGFGAQLLKHVEAIARNRGRTSLGGYFEGPLEGLSPDGDTVAAKSGSGGLPLADPAVAFALASGYDLEQVERSSELALPVPPELLSNSETDARARSADYEVICWDDACPDELAINFAALKSQMSVDVPTAGMDWGREDWDVARVRHGEQALAAAGTQSVVAAAKHRESGDLVAYTVLIWRPAIPAAVLQDDTLVVAAHRGHALGMLVKIANLRRAQERWPAAKVALTWNASENQHMLAINGALGFMPAGYEGEWQKRLG